MNTKRYNAMVQIVCAIGIMAVVQAFHMLGVVTILGGIGLAIGTAFITIIMKEVNVVRIRDHGSMTDLKTQYTQPVKVMCRDLYVRIAYADQDGNWFMACGDANNYRGQLMVGDIEPIGIEEPLGSI